MDSGRKRKATTDAPSTNSIKKIRLVNPNAAASNGSEVQKVGYKLIDQLGRAADKTGRPIATQFQTLPSREELPDYYTFTKLPIAIETVRQKLDRNEYPSVTVIESDFKRMVQNAKDYNTAGSDIYEDAERIRKLVYNYMKAHNPEYKSNPDYVSFPTAIPGEAAASNGKPTAISNARSEKSRRVSTAPTESPAPSETKSIAKNGTSSYGPDDFEGKTFQQAQEMIVEALLNHKDGEDLEIFIPFANLPSRKLEDYYKLIKHPVSLKGLNKKVQGIHGRDVSTGHTDFKTWDAFENEASFIWRNAREYNEDESDMYILAGEFEEEFKLLLEAAKSRVEEPSGPRIKLGGPKPRFTINLSQRRDSPSSVQDGGKGIAQNEYQASPAINGTRAGSALQDVRPVSSHAGSDADGIKLENRATASPAPGLNPALTNGSMLPPGMRPPSDSPMPNGHFPSSYTFTAPAALPLTPLRQYPASEALLPEIVLSTPANVELKAPLKLVIRPHETLSVQSLTLTVPTSHTAIQISSTIAKRLAVGRPYKVFVTINGTRQTQRDTVLEQNGTRTHVYEGVMAIGVNRVEVEVAAARDGENKGLDIEKTIVYVNVMKPT